jgi:Zn-dependent peptidase ImmA (M78 family)
MDFSKFKAPYISEADIKSRADQVRLEHWGDIIPVDVEKILEPKLKLSVVPSPGMYKLSGFDAFISSNWDYIYVDNDRYLDDLHYKRVRFSLAHELGHLILHKSLYESLEFAKIEDFYAFYETVNRDQYSFLETQANKFAGHFLIPRDKLQEEFQKLKKKKTKILKEAGLEGIGDHVLIGYMVDELAAIFNVSSHALQVCLNSKL